MKPMSDGDSNLAVHQKSLSTVRMSLASGESGILGKSRLCRQGVLQCVAAGNDGVISINDGASDDPLLISADLSIGDPGNLESSICVGSVHKESPMLHGVSCFSSRGPTADGRAKPDVVTHGERILSCNADFDPRVPKSWCVAASGTSMACTDSSLHFCQSALNTLDARMK
jgi:hypothetical protein